MYGRGDTDALDILVAKADKDARKTSGYDPSKYTGTYVATASSQGTVRRSVLSSRGVEWFTRNRVHRLA